MITGRVVHCKRNTYDIYIGRPSILGNPFSHVDTAFAEFRVVTRAEAISKFRTYAVERMRNDDTFRVAMLACRGRVLGCWCAPKACHGHAILEIVEEMEW